MRLIDADALIIDLLKKAMDDAFLTGNADTHRLLVQVVAHYPTVDAVPVIRCRECMWYVIDQLKADETPDRRYKPSFCILHRIHSHDYAFCSWAYREDSHES